MKQFQGKVVVLTGAAGNLGVAVAGAFADAGATLLLIDVNEPSLKRAYPESNALLHPLALDILDPNAVASAMKSLLEKLGKVDVLCNLAGGFRMGTPVHDTPAESWKFLMDLNAVSILHMTQALVPNMLASGGGKIINVAAQAGLSGRALMGAYSASKSAVIRLTESMAAELRDSGINVNCVMPSIIDTPLNRNDMPDADFSKWVAPAALADAILFLASDAARAVHGAALPVYGLS